MYSKCKCRNTPAERSADESSLQYANVQITPKVMRSRCVIGKLRVISTELQHSAVKRSAGVALG